MPTREEVKRATAGRSPKRTEETPEALPVLDTPVTSVFPARRVVTIRGREFILSPLDINDLIEAENEYGSMNAFMEKVESESLSALRYFCFLMLRKADDTIETPADAGALLPIRIGELTTIFQALTEASGISDPNDAGTEPKTAAVLSTGL